MSPSASPATGAPLFVARQPILDKTGRVYGYELLYRKSETQGPERGTSGDVATAAVIDSIFSLGFETLASGKRAFINVSRRLLLEGVPSVLPKDRVVLELGTDIEADSEVLSACRELKKAGYTLAIDDFSLNAWTAELVPLADFIKVDFLQARESSVRLPAIASGEGPTLVAKRIETAERFKEAVMGGYDLFQGFFLGKPTITQTRTVPAQHVASLRLMHALHDPDLTIDRLEELVKHDPALCFLILRTINSATYALRTQVQSIREALVLLGRDTIRRWAALWALAGLSQHAHAELLTMATVRARCCELLGASTGDDNAASEGFLTGMCSLLDAILEQPMPALVKTLPLPQVVHDALLGADNRPRHVLDCTVAYEEGSWDQCFELAKKAGVNPTVLPAAYAEALRWSNELKTGQVGARA